LGGPQLRIAAAARGGPGPHGLGARLNRRRGRAEGRGLLRGRLLRGGRLGLGNALRSRRPPSRPAAALEHLERRPERVATLAAVRLRVRLAHRPRPRGVAAGLGKPTASTRAGRARNAVGRAGTPRAGATARTCPPVGIAPTGGVAPAGGATPPIGVITPASHLISLTSAGSARASPAWCRPAARGTSTRSTCR